MIKLSAKLTTAPVENMLKKRGLEPGGPAEKLMGGEALRLSEPYVPKGGGTLKRAGTAAPGGLPIPRPTHGSITIRPQPFRARPCGATCGLSA